MKNKKLILFLIILFPSLFWVILEFSTINTRKLPHYGPRTLDGKDTVFYKVTSALKTLTTGNDSALNGFPNDSKENPLYAVCFIKQSYKTDNYRMAGLTE